MKTIKQWLGFNALKVILLSGLLFPIQSFCQSGAFYFQFKPTGQIQGTYDTLYRLKIVTEVADTNTVSALKIKIGSEEGLSDIFNGSFNYDVYEGLPEEMEYEREGNIIKCLLGIFVSNVYYYDVRLVDLTGNVSSSLPFDWTIGND